MSHEIREVYARRKSAITKSTIRYYIVKYLNPDVSVAVTKRFHSRSEAEARLAKLS